MRATNSIEGGTPSTVSNDSSGVPGQGPDDSGFVLIGVVVALVPIAVAVGMFLTTMQGKSSRLRTDLAQERALLVAESGVDDALFRANQMLITHGGTYTRDLGNGQSFRVEPIHLQYDGVDNDADGILDLLDDDEEVIQVVVTGSFGNTSRRVAAYLGATPFLPTLTSAVTASNPTITLDLTGNGYITGEDTDTDGNPIAGTATDVVGMSMASPGTLADLAAEVDPGEVGSLLGLGATATDPSIGTSAAIDLVTIVNVLRNTASNVVTATTNSNEIYGTKVKPEITFREGDVHMTGNTKGAGILVVTGDLKATGRFEFIGIVIVLGKVNAAVGQAQFRGAVITGPSSSKVDMSGRGNISYSSSGVALASSLGGSFTAFNGWQELAR